MYKCLKCGKTFSEEEIKRVSEYRGEYYGMPCYEDVEYSPCCMEDFVTVEATEFKED